MKNYAQKKNHKNRSNHKLSKWNKTKMDFPLSN